MPDTIQRGWNQWIKGLQKYPVISVANSIVNSTKGKISLQGFVDVSKLAVCGAMYVVIICTPVNTGKICW